MSALLPDPKTARRVIHEAAGWYSQLCSGEATAEDRTAWQRWLAQGWEQQWAWAQVESLQQQLQLAPAEVTHEVLHASSESMQARRREWLKGLGIFAFMTPFAWYAWRNESWQYMLADYSTTTGERREWILSDGTRLVLNTNSAVSISFDAHMRVVKLIKGEIFIQTGQSDLGKRPFIVQTAQGSLRALGTQFIVRQQQLTTTWLGVIEHAVVVTPNTGRPAFQVNVGQQVTLDDGGPGDVKPLTGNEKGWLRGMLVVTDWRLADVVAELSRYRVGVLRCDPRLSDQRISGVFPLDQPEIALEAIQTALPQVSIVYFTRYWVNLSIAT